MSAATTSPEPDGAAGSDPGGQPPLESDSPARLDPGDQPTADGGSPMPPGPSGASGREPQGSVGASRPDADVRPRPAQGDSSLAHPADPDLVRAALADAASLGLFFALTTGDEPGDWRLATELYRDGLAAVIDRTARQLNVTEPRVAAATVHLGYAARLWSPVLYCALVHGVVPDLAGLRVISSPSLRLNLPAPAGWQIAPGPAQQPSLPSGSATLPPATASPSPTRPANASAPEQIAPDATTALAVLIYRTVLSGHLEPLAAALPVKVAPGLLRGNAASALTAALRVLVASRPALAPAARDLAQALLTTGTLSGTGALRSTGTAAGPGLEFLRRSCCLFYRVPDGGYCGDCPLPVPARRPS